MIESISKLDPKTKDHVLLELRKRGAKSNGGEYCKYPYAHLKDLARFLNHHFHSLEHRQIEEFLNNFNSRELGFLKQLQNSTHIDNLPAKVRQANTRTRLAVQRILDKVEEKDNKEDVGTAWGKIKSVFA